MKKRVLVAVDLSESSLRAVDYLGEMLHCHENVEVTLLHVIKEPSPDIVLEEAARKEQVELLRKEALALMEKAGRSLVSLGISEDRIKLMVHFCKKPVSVSDLILREQQSGGYDAIVIGKQGKTKRERFLFGSVSSRVAQEARGCAVWIVE